MLVQTSADRLNRATGRTIIAAATATEPALEGYKGHGIFTYALNEALQLADTGDKDGVISILEVVLYLSRRVPALSREVFKIEQLISQQTYGQDFPLVAIRPDASQ
jgi:hypothetical protein